MRPEAPIRILIVEDSQPVRRQLRRLIERQLPGVVVEEAEDGCEAVEKITQQSPDIAILDIAMPVLNGLLAIEKIAAIDSELPVIVLSSTAYMRLRRWKARYASVEQESSFLKTMCAGCYRF